MPPHGAGGNGDDRYPKRVSTLPQDHEPATSDRSDWRMLALSWALYFCFSFTVASLFPIVGSVREDLHLTYVQVGLILGSWQIVYLAAAIPVGTAVDRFSTRWVLFVGTLVVASSQVARSYADSFATMLAAVALLGVGGPAMSVGLPKVIANSFVGRHRPLASGVYVTGAQVGQMTALALTNVLVLQLFDSWRVTLRVYAAIVVVVALTWAFLARGPAPTTRARQPPEGMLAGMRHITRVPGLWIVVAIGCSGFLASHGYRTWLPEMLMAKGIDPTQAGFIAAVPALCGIAGSILLVRFASHGRRKRTAQTLLVVVGSAIVVAALASGPLVVAAVMIEGFCAAALMPLMMNTLMELPGVGAAYMGAAAGLYFSVGEIGGFAGPTLIGAVVGLTGSFTLGMSLLAIVMWLMLIPASRLPEPNHP